MRPHTEARVWASLWNGQTVLPLSRRENVQQRFPSVRKRRIRRAMWKDARHDMLIDGSIWALGLVANALLAEWMGKAILVEAPAVVRVVLPWLF